MTRRRPAASCSPRSSDRFPPGLLGLVGTVFGVTGMSLLADLPEHPRHIDIMWRLVFIAAGSGTFFAPNARQIIFTAPMDRAAAAGGLTQTTRMAGQVVGSTVTAGLLALGVGAGPMPSLVAAAFFSVSGLCCLVLLGTGRSGR